MNHNKLHFVKLPNRGLIHIEGEDRYEFLQNLISNDMKLLEKQKALYACLLTPQGKFLHDFFVIEGNSFLLLDCEGGERALDLYKRLNLYRLRSKVQISVEEQNNVYALMDDRIIGLSDDQISGRPNIRLSAHPDPRHSGLGWRSFTKPEDAEEKPFDAWDEKRIRLCIPDGSRDMVPEKSTLMECNLDKLHGISFEKGCYVGQELTARMHHRGLAKKHLYAIEGDNLPETGADIEVDSKLIGEMRSKYGNTGIALLKDDSLEGVAFTVIS